MEKSTARLEFSFYPTSYNNVNLSFDCDQDMTLDEFKSFCMRMAYAMSYPASSIEEVFGSDES